MSNTRVVITQFGDSDVLKIVQKAYDLFASVSVEGKIVLLVRSDQKEKTSQTNQLPGLSVLNSQLKMGAPRHSRGDSL